MKLAILGSRGFPSTYGGFETFIRRLAPYLSARGHDVTVYCRGQGLSVSWRSDVQQGVRCVYTPGWDRKTVSTLSFGLTASIDAMFRRYDSVLVLNVANGFYVPFIKRTGARVLVNVDGLEWNRAKWNSVGKRTFRLGAAMTARSADEVIADAETIADYWLENLHREAKFIPYGGDLERERSLERVTDIGLDPGTYGLVVARLATENNVEMVLDALDQLPRDLPFVVVGSSSHGHPIERRLKQMHATRPNFLWLGHVADQELLTDLWFHCGVYVHGHSVGGTNPALLQALGAGANVAAYDTPFSREVMSDADSAHFFTDASSLVKCIETALGGSSDREATADAAREIVEDKYSWDEVLKAYEKLMTNH